MQPFRTACLLTLFIAALVGLALAAPAARGQSDVELQADVVMTQLAMLTSARMLSPDLSELLGRTLSSLYELSIGAALLNNLEGYVVTLALVRQRLSGATPLCSPCCSRSPSSSRAWAPTVSASALVQTAPRTSTSLSLV
jgi:hypothetical protein